MTYEQLHFAFGMMVPFLVTLFFYRRKFIFWSPLVMTLAGVVAFLPHFFNWSGKWTNFFFFYDIIHTFFSRGQFYGFALIVGMFLIVAGFQARYLWRRENA